MIDISDFTLAALIGLVLGASSIALWGEISKLWRKEKDDR